MAGEGDIFGGAVSGAVTGGMAAGPWGALAGGALGLAGGLFSFLGKSSQARAMARQNAEELRRKRMENAQLYGKAVAAGAASGVEFGSGSLQTVLSDMRNEMARQEQWQAQAGNTNVNNLRGAAGIGLFTDLAGTLNTVAKANNYWQTAAPKVTSDTVLV